MGSSHNAGIKFFLILVAAFAFFTYAHDLVKEFVFSGFDDVKHYYANTILLRDGFDAYQWDEATKKQNHKIRSEFQEEVSEKDAPIHSLSFFFIFLPFSYLPYMKAAYLWVLLCQIAFISSILLIFKMFKKVSLENLMMSIFIIFSFWPLREDLHLGQTNFLILFFFTASLFFIRRKEDFVSGVCLALAIQLKEIFLPLLLLFLIKKKWRVILGAILILSLLRGIAILTFGADMEISYWQYHMQLFANTSIKTTPINICFLASLGRMLKPFLAEKIIYLFVMLFNLYLIIKTSLLVRTRGDNLEGRSLLEFVIFILLCFLITPWLHETHLVVLILPILVSWFLLKEFSYKGAYILFVVSYLLLALKYSVARFYFLHSGLPAIFLSLKLLGCFLLFILIYKLLKTKNMPQN